jgi:hypothetical protein
MDPKALDVIQMALFYHLTRFVADGILPPETKLFIKEMTDLQNFNTRCASDLIPSQTIAVLINRFSGAYSLVTAQFEREHPEMVQNAIAQICRIPEFKDFISWYIDIRVSDGLTHGKAFAERQGFYVSSSPSKTLLVAHMRGVSDIKVPDKQSGRGVTGSGCLMPLVVLGTWFFAMFIVLLTLF